MSPFASHFSFVISLGAIAMQAAIVFLIFCVVFKKQNPVLLFVQRYSALLAFLTALAGVIASLVYSEIIGFAPCTLCYLQRIFLYPQVLILGYLLFRESLVARRIVIGLSIIGAGIGIYHYYGQMFNSAALTCSIGTDGTSLCAQIPFVEFGYITIPMLSLTSFALIITLLALGKQRQVQ